MLKDGLITELQSSAKFFRTSTSCLQEADSNFAPQEVMYSVAAHVAHAAHTITWFIDGAFRKSEFDKNWEESIAEAKKCTSFTEAMERFETAIADAIAVITEKSDEELYAPIQDPEIMNGAPKLAIVGGITEHTAHHRGSLAVYSRLLGKVPEMPYS